MKKKQLLATLVMLSLMQGSVYAAEVPDRLGAGTYTYNEDTILTGGISLGAGQSAEITVTNGKGTLSIKTGDTTAVSMSNGSNNLTINGNVVFEGETYSAITLNGGDNQVIHITGNLDFRNMTGSAIKGQNGAAAKGTGLVVDGKITVDNVNLGRDTYAIDGSIFALYSTNIQAKELEIKNSSLNKRSDYGTALFLNNSRVDINSGNIKIDNILTNEYVNYGLGSNGIYAELSNTIANDITVSNLTNNVNENHLQGICNSTQNIITANTMNIKNIINKGNSDFGKNHVSYSIGLQQASDDSDRYKETKLNVGTLNIDNIISENDEAYGMYSYGALEDNGKIFSVIDNITITNVQGRTNALGLYNANGASLDVDNNLIINNVTAQSGEAIGAQFSAIDKIGGLLKVTNINGNMISSGVIVINSKDFSVKTLYVEDIDAKKMVNGLYIMNSNSQNVEDVYINVNENSIKTYDGKYFNTLVDDNNDNKADITRVALRANAGATVDWQAGGYEIYGAIVAGKGDENAAGAGNITISGDNNKIYGDVFAGNGGTINLNLGAGSVFEGQIDDYHELGTSLAGNTFHNSAFDLDVTTAGSVDLTLANGATWIARGQSYLSDLTNNGLVDMSQNENSSVTVSKLSGDGTIKMLLNAENKGSSDMLYVTDSVNGTQTIEVDWANGDGVEALKAGERLRFATTNGDVEHLNARTTDAGFFNVRYTTSTDEYSAADEDDENKLYNSEGTGQSSYKPGNDFADETFDGTGTNHYILGIDDSKSELSDAGQTIINMSRANYSNAIYMDRLNKRMGEARYINPEDEQGMWVRLRHDRIGKEDAFRSQNTMYEMGYDVKQDCDNGDRRVGFAIDYMDGKTEYRNVAGDGDIKRYGLWLYDTWMGDKGHYADYVLKWGHLENDFDIYNSRGKVNGDYSNNVFSVSAEYGKKNDIGNDWYFEPQAQLQLARVTGADYVTSQKTKVSLDGINSLIGRAGFRLGKDMGERSTVYVKADVLHEFLGDQTISALDTTTNGTYRETFENKGTWYDVGFGFATALGKDSYAFMDFEKSFGNDNDETYQINAGVQWTF